MVKKEYATKVEGDKGNFVPKEKVYGENKNNSNYEKALNRKAARKIREALQNKKDDEEDDISQPPELPTELPKVRKRRKFNDKKDNGDIVNKSTNYHDYSDKVFNQRDYQFRRRQRDLFNEKNQRGSFFSEGVHYDYSGNLKQKSRVKKNPEKKEKTYIFETEEDEDKAKSNTKTSTKEYEKRVNERMMYERRYKKMREKIDESKYYSKKVIKAAERGAKSYLPALIAVIVLFLLLYTFVAGATGVFIGSFSGGVVTTDIAESTWTSKRIDIDKAEDYFYHKLLELDEEIEGIKNDTYQFINVDDYLHYDHFALISYLSAFYKGTFVYGRDVEYRLDTIFNNLFSYSSDVTTETYPIYTFNPDTGDFDESEGSYDVLNIHITVLDIDDYAESTLNAEQLEHYYRMQSIEGGRQAFAAPAANFRNRVREYYTIENEHLVLKTVSGNPVYFLRNGTVTEVGSDYVIVENTDDGSKYMISGITGINTVVGAEAVRGIRMANTTEEMTVKLWVDDEIINPLFYLRAN